MSYDYMGRRFKKVTAVWSNSAWLVVATNRYVYDGWNVVQEIGRKQLDQSSTNFYTWGLDLSGTMQGAGGIGGVLASYMHRTNAISQSLYCMDGNGNLAARADEGNGVGFRP